MLMRFRKDRSPKRVAELAQALHSGDPNPILSGRQLPNSALRVWRRHLGTMKATRTRIRKSPVDLARSPEQASGRLLGLHEREHTRFRAMLHQIRRAVGCASDNSVKVEERRKFNEIPIRRFRACASIPKGADHQRLH